MDFLWDVVREPYYKFTARRGSLVMRLGGARIRFPAHHARHAWEQYEPEAMRFYRALDDCFGHAVIADIGAAIGVYAHVALSVSPLTQVIAADADVASLCEVERLTSIAAPTGDGERLRLVHGLISETDSVPGATRERALAATRHAMTAADGSPRYVCIGDEGSANVPTYTIDTLIGDLGPDVPLLLKIDIEGAELLALRGARRVLTRPNTTLLLSVHPYLIRRYGHEVGDVERFLEWAGYSHRIIGIDTEQHWVCEHSP